MMEFLEEKTFRDWIWGGCDEETEELLSSWVCEYDADECEDEFQNYLEDKFSARVCIDAGVERMCVFAPDWEYVYKFRINGVGEGDDDFEYICGEAETYGVGDVFVMEDYVDTIGGSRITRQKMVRGEYGDELVRVEDEYKSFSKASQLLIEDMDYRDVVVRIFSLYGEPFGQLFCHFLDDFRVSDLHRRNYAVVDGKVQIFDAVLCAY